MYSARQSHVEVDGEEVGTKRWRDGRRGGDPGGLMTHGCAAARASPALAGGGDSGEVYAFNYSLPI